MIKILLSLFVCVLVSFSGQSQIIDFPDPNFKQALINKGVDTNGDGEIEVNEAQVIDSLRFVAGQISDFTGIKSFSNLASLEINSCLMQNLNLSGMTSISKLQIYFNENLEELNVSGASSLSVFKCVFNDVLGVMDLNGLTSLLELQLSQNKAMTFLDLSELLSLRQIDIDNFEQLSSINLQGLISLEEIKVENNDLLMDMDLSGLSSLRLIDFGSSAFTNLDLSGLNLLEEIILRYNSALTDLNLSGLNSLRVLTVRNNVALASLDLSSLTNLEVLSIRSHDALQSLNVSGLPSLSTLELVNNDALSIVDLQNLSSLKVLELSTNASLGALDLSEIPLLEIIEIENNQNLTNLDFSQLMALEELTLCSNNFLDQIVLTGLYALSNLELLDNPELDNFDISELTSLKKLIVVGNGNLTSLNANNLNTVEEFVCSNNGWISSLNLEGLTSVRNFDLTNNYVLDYLDLTGMPSLINATIEHNLALTTVNLGGLGLLKELRCNYNDVLTEIDVSDLKSVELIGCISNDISGMDLSGLDSLKSLFVYDNFSLSHLDMSDCESFDWLSGWGCPFEYLNFANGIPMNNINIDVDNLNYLCVDDQDEKDWFLAEYPQTTAIINTGCNFVQGGTFYELEGKVSYEDQGDCNGIEAVSVSDLLFFKVIEGGNELGVVGPGFNSDMEYQIILSAGNYEIVPIFNSNHVSINPAVFDLELPGVSGPVVQDFCLNSNGIDIVDLNVHLIPLDVPRPGFEVDYKLVFSNNGNAISSGQIILNYHDPLVQFISASLPVTDNGEDLIFDYIDLQAFEQRELVITLKLNGPMDNPAVNAGDNIFTSLRAIPNENDFNPSDNYTQLREITINSFDPNDKQCLQGDFISDTLVGTHLDYLIRFENTGTGEAVNITVADSIDSSVFVPSSVRVIDASHEVYMQQNGNVVEFIFEDIYLPFDDNNNDGYVAFTIQTTDNLVVGDSLLNNADIYFDFNWPIRTNTTRSVIVTDMDGDGYHNLEDCDDDNPSVNPLAIDIPNNGIDEDCDGMDTTSDVTDLIKNTIAFYPNPASEILFADRAFNGKAVLRTIDGKVALQSHMQNGQLDISTVPPGFYIIELHDDNSKEVYLERIVVD